MSSSTTPHKWASVIKAWADGETIQYKCLVSGEWVDFGGNDDPEPYEGPWGDTDCEWRIKPERWYRVAHMSNSGGDWVYTTTLAQHETSAEGHSEFVRWLTERIYY